MFKKMALGTIAIATILAGFGCGKGYKKTENGLEYKIDKDSTGTTAKPGELVMVKVKVLSDKDSTVYDGFQSPEPIPVLIPDKPKKGSFEEGLTLLSIGDSAAFKIPVDSLIKGADKKNIPKSMVPGTKQTWIIKAYGIVSAKEVAKQKAEFEVRRQEHIKKSIAQFTNGLTEALNRPAIAKQLKADDKILQDFFKKNNIKASKTPEGLYYTIDQPGSGKKLALGDTVNVLYSGSLLTGEVFDASKNHGNSPFPVVLGITEVIPGWHVGLANFQHGAKGKLYIPSPLAYGENEIKGKIAKNSVLIFEVELLKK